MCLLVCGVVRSICFVSGSSFDFVSLAFPFVLVDLCMLVFVCVVPCARCVLVCDVNCVLLFVFVWLFVLLAWLRVRSSAHPFFRCIVVVLQVCLRVFVLGFWFVRVVV